MGKKYVDFKLVERKRKTSVFHVVTVRDEVILGRVVWDGPWHQYVFEPIAETIWSQGCLQQIIDFLQQLKEILPFVENLEN